MPGATWLPIDLSSKNYAPGGMGTIRMYVPHIAVSYSPLHDFFNTYKADPLKRSSAHGWVDTDGTSEQYVSLDDRAYAVGNWNPYAISWESAGVPGTPLTDAQIDVHARNLVALRAMGHPIDLAVNHDDPNGSGVTPHCILGGGHTCPNSGDEMANRPGVIEAQYDQIVARATALENGDDMTPDEVKTAVGEALTAFFGDWANIEAHVKEGASQALVGHGSTAAPAAAAGGTLHVEGELTVT